MIGSNFQNKTIGFSIIAVILFCIAIPFLQAQNREEKAEMREREFQKRMQEIEEQKELQELNEGNLKQEFQRLMTKKNTKIINQDFPGLLDSIEQLHQSNQEDTAEEFEEFLEEILEHIELREEEPEEYRAEIKWIHQEMQLRQMEMKSEHLGRTIQEITFGKKSSGPSRDQLIKELKQLLAEEFDFRLKIRQHEVEQLEKELSERKARVKFRTEKRENIIARRIQELTNENDELDWWE